MRGPPANLTLHNQYDPANDIYTLVGQSESLVLLMRDKIFKMISDDMIIFNIGVFLLNFVLYFLVTIIQERLINKKLIRPIVDLTKDIKNPKERLSK